MKQTLSLDSRVETSENVVSQALEHETVMLDLDSGVYYGLNPVGTRTWDLIQKRPGLPLRNIFDSLLEEYDVPKDQCARDLLNLVGLMQKKGLVEVCNESPTKVS